MPRSTTLASRFAAGFMAMAGALTLAALFPAYFRGGSSLADSAQNIWYNLPSIVAWSGAALLLAFPRTREAGWGLAAASTTVLFGAYLTDVGSLVTGREDVAGGSALGLCGLLAAVIGSGLSSGVAIRHGWLPTARRRATFWAMAAGVIGLLWAVGDTMDWTQIQAHATVPDYTFTRTGSANLRISCCTLLQEHGWQLAGDVAVLVAAVVVPVAAALWSPVWIGVSALVGAAIALAAGPLSTIALLNGAATPAQIGATSADVQAGGLLLSRHGLPGLWLALIAAAGLLLLAVGRYASATGFGGAPGVAPPRDLFAGSAT